MTVELTKQQLDDIVITVGRHGNWDERAMQEAYRLGWQARGRRDQEVCMDIAGHPSDAPAIECALAIARADLPDGVENGPTRLKM